MKPFKLLSAMAICLAMLFVSAPALAQGVPYTASFSTTTSGSLAALSDNVTQTPGTNGFVTNLTTGTLTFAFTGDWNLTNFTIWNNINGTFGGVTAFTLRFYDGNNGLVGTVTKSNVSRNPPPTSIPLTAYIGVRRVEMEITGSETRIEIREIRFDGTRTPVPPTISTCCPVSATFAFPTMFSSVQGNVAGNYHLSFTMNPTFDAQMAAYAALLKALDPSITSTFMVVRAYNGGSGTPAVITGTPLQLGAVFWGPPPGSSGNVWAAFFTAAADLPTDTWTVVEVSVWANRNGMPAVQLCETRRFSFRPQIGARARSSAPGFVDYTGPAPATAPPPVMPPRP